MTTTVILILSIILIASPVSVQSGIQPCLEATGSCDGRSGSCCVSGRETSCATEDCDVAVEWQYDVTTDKVRFFVTAQLTDFDTSQYGKWAAIGFSNDLSMTNTDVVIGWVNELGVPQDLTDRYIDTVRTRPAIDANSNIENQETSFENGTFVFKFTRALSTGDDKDIALNNADCIHFLYAVGPVGDANIGYHGNTRFNPNIKICFNNCKTEVPCPAVSDSTTSTTESATTTTTPVTSTSSPPSTPTVPSDPCSTSPCPVSATCVPEPSRQSGHFCVCSGNFKGPNCTEEDPLVMCQPDRTVNYRLDNNIPAIDVPEDSSIILCAPKTGGTNDSICYDPDGEELRYSLETNLTDILTLTETVTSQCIGLAPGVDVSFITSPVYCVRLVASEADDLQYRPYRNDSVEVCVRFNHPPRLELTGLTLYNVAEMSAVENVTLNGSDPDDGQSLFFSVIGFSSTDSVVDQKYFTLVGDILQVTRPAVDPADLLKVNITIQVEDSGIPSLTASRLIRFSFYNASLRCSVSEDPIYVQLEPPLEADTVIGSISCQDLRPNEQPSFNVVQPEAPPLIVVNSSGSIILFSTMSELTPGTYDLEVNVKMFNIHKLQVETTVTATIIMGFFQPQCPPVEPLHILENATDCIAITQCTFIHPDQTFQCGDTNLQSFQANCSGRGQVDLCPAGQLNPGTTQVRFDVINNYGVDTVVFNVTVDNVNDAPEILSGPQNLHVAVNEDSNMGTTSCIATVTDSDVQFGDILSAEVLPDEPIEGDTLYPFTAEVQQNIILCIRVQTQLNATEWHEYNFTVEVRDTAGLMDSVKVSVSVKDVNEAPQCPTSVQFSASLDTPVNSIIGTVSCYDVDVNQAFKAITYSLEDSSGESAQYIVIDAKTGDIRLRSSLTGHPSTASGVSFSMDFTVLTADGGGLQTQVPVTIVINTDFPPQCNTSTVQVNVSETFGIQTCIPVKIACSNPLGGNLTFTMDESLNGTELFLLESGESTETEIVLCPNQNLNRRPGFWHLSVNIQNDYGLDSVSIIVKVIDKNEPPVFNPAAISVNLTEDWPLKEVFSNLRNYVQDPDTGAFAELEFQGLSGLDRIFFVATNGSLWLMSPLDYETATLHLLTIQVTDGGGLSATATLTVDVVDVNDNQPDCSETSSKTEIDLIAKQGLFVYQLKCTDVDTTPQPNQLTYVISSQPSDAFGVSGTGLVTLEGPLWRNVTQYDVEVLVHDPDHLNTTFYLTVLINNDYPPVCTQDPGTTGLQENDKEGTCLSKRVRCEDRSDGEMEVTHQSGNGFQIVQLQQQLDAAQILTIELCTNATLKERFEEFNTLITVSNDLGSTNVSWTWFVEDVNEAPVFLGTPNIVDVEETRSVGNTVLTLSVSDPDTRREFSLRSVSAVLLGEQSQNFNFVNTSVYVFLLVVQRGDGVGLNATVRNLYTYQVTATDYGGLSTTENVTFNIVDVNEIPICTASKINIQTSLLAESNSVLTKWICWDTDRVPEFRNLTYTVDSVSPQDSNLFDVNEKGEIILLNKFPRDPAATLYGLGLTVRDGGSPPLSSTATVSVVVDTQIPADCDPYQVTPDVWFINECLNVSMRCVDLTLDGTTHLKYGLLGNYTAGFRLTNNGDGEYTLCYTKVDMDGYFILTVNVDNGLLSKAYTIPITVVYSQSTPKFNQSSYTKDVKETTEPGTVVTVVEATVTVNEGGSGRIVYKILDEGSSSNWQNYFIIRNLTGSVVTAASLKSLANTAVTLKIEAQQTQSLLKSTAELVINIVDVNEKPVCGIGITEKDLTVLAPVNTEIVSFTCSDADINKDFNRDTLRFDISGNLVDSFFEVLETPTGGIKIRTLALLKVDQASYVLTFRATDGGQLSSDPHLITVNVDLTPPPVLVQVVALNPTSIRVSWSYERDDFASVTPRYTVHWLLGDNGTTKDTQDQSVDIMDLQPSTTYAVFVVARTNYGDVTSEERIVDTPAVEVIQKVIVSYRITSKTFDILLRNNNTLLYAQFSAEESENWDLALKDSSGYRGVKNLGYRPGSVESDIEISVNQSGSPDAIKADVTDAIATGNVGNYKVDTDYIVLSEFGGYVHVEKISPAVDVRKSNGSDLTLWCRVVTVRYQASEVEYVWKRNGVVIRPSSGSRFSIGRQTDTTTSEISNMTLSVRPLFARDTGVYECSVRHQEGSSSSRDVSITVISQPIVTVSPATKTVDSRNSVSITCTLSSPRDEDTTFIWLKNGSSITPSTAEFVNTTDYLSILTIASIVETTIFACQGQNEAGQGPKVESVVHVIKTVTTPKCPESRDNGLIWEVTLAGTTAVLPCAPGFSGLLTRYCSSSGQWRAPLNGCVKEAINQLQEEAEQLKDGTSNTTTTEILESMKKETEDSVTLSEGDIQTVAEVLNSVVEITEADDQDISETNVADFLDSVNNIINDDSRPQWEVLTSEGYGADFVLKSVDTYANLKSRKLSGPDTGPQVFGRSHLVVIVGRSQAEDLQFPPPNVTMDLPDWSKENEPSVFLSKEALGNQGEVPYSGVIFNNVSTILLTRIKQNGNVEDSSRDINSVVVAFQVVVKQSISKLNPPLRIQFPLYSDNYSDPLCSFLDYSIPEESGGIWSTEGCYVESVTDYVAVCRCDHFTNFAVLMSPGKTPEKDLVILSTISAVGCAISLFCLLATIVLHVMVWRYVKSDRAVILLHLCVALMIAYTVFLAGVNRTEYEDLCTAIAAVMHYIYLVVFFLMLAEGIEVAVQVIYVFFTRSRLRWILPLSWIAPAIIVGISLGVTKLEGYGTEDHCWLSLDNWLLLAFIVPAGLVILINIIIILVVIRKMLKSSMMLTKTDIEKAKSTVRSMCVLLPVMGVTWVLGVFSVNEDLVAFQYAFAICNALQGMFIFIFHCLLNKQIRDGLKRKSVRKKSLATFESDMKNLSQSDKSKPSKLDKSNKKKKDSLSSSSRQYDYVEPAPIRKFAASEDLSKTVDSENQGQTPSSNPFLEADRQMQELVNKVKKDGKSNLLYDNVDSGPKNNVVEKKNIDVSLEDVKISNILRESEATAAVAGASLVPTSEGERRARSASSEEEKKTRSTSDLTAENRQQEQQGQVNQGFVDDPRTSRVSYDYPDVSSMQPAVSSSSRKEPQPAKPSESQKGTYNISRPAGYEKLLRAGEGGMKPSSSYDKLQSSDGRPGASSAYERQRMAPDSTYERQRVAPDSTYERQRVAPDSLRQYPGGVIAAKPYEDDRYRSGSGERIKAGKSTGSKSSKSSSDDYEARLKENQKRLQSVYTSDTSLPRPSKQEKMREKERASRSPQRRYSPSRKQYEPELVRRGVGGAQYVKAKDIGPPKKSQGKKGSKRDRSRDYQYAYDVAYMGQQGPTHHGSVENVPMQVAMGYHDPYGGMRPFDAHRQGHDPYNPYQFYQGQRTNYWP